MGYTHAVQKLSELSEEEFLAIPPCKNALAVLRNKEFSKVETAQNAWIYELCRDISPEDPNRPWPRYLPLYTLARGGMGLLFAVYDQWQKKQAVLKIPIPAAQHDAHRVIEQQREQQDEKPELLKGGAKLRQFAKKAFRRAIKDERTGPVEIQEIPRKTKEEIAREKIQQAKIRESSYYARFEDSHLVQEQLHRIASKVDPRRALGYIPAAYTFGYHPKCYSIQEFVDGELYFDWILRHSDKENFDLFLRLVIFIEKVFHAIKIAHCDLNPTNILVTNDHCVVLDYGAVKSPALKSKTLDNTQIGTIGFGSPGQLKDAKNRGPWDDVFTLGRILYITLTRRLPAITVIAEEDEHGRQSVDDNFIARHYPPGVLEEKYQEIFLKTQRLRYKNISEFRSELERTVFPELDTGHTCQAPCKELLELYNIVKVLLSERNDDE